LPPDVGRGLLQKLATKEPTRSVAVTLARRFNAGINAVKNDVVTSATIDLQTSQKVGNLIGR
jgi:hypothetical protein